MKKLRKHLERILNYWYGYTELGQAVFFTGKYRTEKRLPSRAGVITATDDDSLVIEVENSVTVVAYKSEENAKQNKAYPLVDPWVLADNWIPLKRQRRAEDVHLSTVRLVSGLLGFGMMTAIGLGWFIGAIYIWFKTAFFIAGLFPTADGVPPYVNFGVFLGFLVGTVLLALIGFSVLPWWKRSTIRHTINLFMTNFNLNYPDGY